MSASPYSSRRRRRRSWAAYAACIVAGLAIGVGGSVLKPGPWFAPADALELPEREPRVGEALCVAGECAFILEALPPADDGRVVAIYWLRGRAGREAWRVTDCAAGEGVVTALDGRQRQRWKRDGTGIVDAIAAAACGPQSADSGA